MKTAIVTLYGQYNYGNRLQNYAMHYVLKSHGVSAESVSSQSNPHFGLRSIIKSICFLLFPRYTANRWPSFVRYLCFKRFTKKYMPTKLIKNAAPAYHDSIKDKYSKFVVGSDQVWNPCFLDSFEERNNMFLTMVPSSQKVAFAPSFGVSSVPTKWEEYYRNSLQSFDRLSVREESGAKIIKQLTGKDAVVLIDPTLLLDAKDWEKVMKKVSDLPKNYILDYFLGSLPIENVDSINGEFEGISHINPLSDDDPYIYASGPAEFLYMMRNATLICTDSFHACVFSIIFDKPFVVFQRKEAGNDMFSRIESLLALFDISAKEVIGQKVHIEKSKRDAVLQVQRERCITFLEESHVIEAE